MTDNVNHPGHYGGEDNPYETIKVIEAWELDFCLGNAVKYIARAGKKGDAFEDLQKAVWYLERKMSQIVTQEILADPDATSAAPPPAWTKPVPIEELPKTYECWGGGRSVDKLTTEQQTHAYRYAASEDCWPEDSTITVRYVRKSDEDPYPTASWSEYATGSERAGELAKSAAKYFGRMFPERYAIKMPGQPRRSYTDTLSDFAKPDDILFLVEA
jgi:hypothetical protein